VLLLAGGIGITPLLAMAWVLQRQGRPFVLRHCVRSTSLAAFRAELQGPLLGPHSGLHADDGPAGQRLDLPALLRQAGPQAQAYVCGPPGFMQWVADTVAAQGWAPERLHQERFGAPAPATGREGGDAVHPSNAPSAKASASAEHPFAVVLASSGQRVGVPPGQSVLAALRAAGVAIPASCEQGLCGTCAVTVLAGQPEHRDSYLSPAEQAAGRFLPCCSRARSPTLVLDL
jgi:vanillate O-demethylase ferredoxin subunit